MEFAAFVISFIALVFAVPPMLQMYCGRPVIRVKPNDQVIGGVRVLRYFVSSQPITNKFLKWIRVRPDPTDISVNFTVCESGSGKVVVHLVRAQIKNERGEYANQVALASFIPAIVAVVICDDSGARIITEENVDADHGVPIERGRYRAKFTVIYSHNNFFEFAAEFTAGTKPDELYWVGKPKILRVQ